MPYGFAYWIPINKGCRRSLNTVTDIARLDLEWKGRAKSPNYVPHGAWIRERILIQPQTYYTTTNNITVIICLAFGIDHK